MKISNINNLHKKWFRETCWIFNTYLLGLGTLDIISCCQKHFSVDRKYKRETTYSLVPYFLLLGPTTWNFKTMPLSKNQISVTWTYVWHTSNQILTPLIMSTWTHLEVLISILPKKPHIINRDFKTPLSSFPRVSFFLGFLSSLNDGNCLWQYVFIMYLWHTFTFESHKNAQTLQTLKHFDLSKLLFSPCTFKTTK